MMPVQTARPLEPRGMLCPTCNEPIFARSMVNKSYPSPAGHHRSYYCRNERCGAHIETCEHVIGLVPEVLDISDLHPAQVKLVRGQVEVLRSHNRMNGQKAHPPPRAQTSPLSAPLKQLEAEPCKNR